MMYQYFVKIVPTIYVKTDGEVSPELVYFTLNEIILNELMYVLQSEHHQLILISLTQCFVVILFLQVLKTNQFSVTRHEKVANGLVGDQGLPGVFVLYELSPMMVKFTEKHR